MPPHDPELRRRTPDRQRRVGVRTQDRIFDDQSLVADAVKRVAGLIAPLPRSRPAVNHHGFKVYAVADGAGTKALGQIAAHVESS